MRCDLYYLHLLHQADERWNFHKTSCAQVMSLKYHIIHFIVKDMEKQLEIDKKKVKPRQLEIEGWDYPTFSSFDHVCNS